MLRQLRKRNEVTEDSFCCVNNEIIDGATTTISHIVRERAGDADGQYFLADVAFSNKLMQLDERTDKSKGVDHDGVRKMVCVCWKW